MPTEHLHSKSLAHGRAITLVVLACFVLAGMDALGKHLMQHLPPTQVVWARYTFHTLLVGAIFGLRHHRHFLRPQHPWWQLIRGLCLLGVTFGMYLAIRVVSLGEATAIMFLAPILVTLLAAPVLHESIRPVHGLAVALGFIGVLVILRPGSEGFQPTLLLPLGSAVLLAVYFILTRHLRGRDSELVTLFHTTVAGSVGLTICLPLFWHAPTLSEWPLLLLMGALGASGHLMLIRAFHLAGAATLSPWLNTQILAAALYGAGLYGASLTLHFLAGTLLIVAGGLLTSRRTQETENPAAVRK